MEQGDEIAAISKLDLDGLRQRWRRLFGRTAPAHLSRQLLLRILAYEVQVRKHGDLSRETKKLLAAISTAASGRSAGSGKDVPVPPAPDLRPLMPGAELVREHDGVMHRVMVLRDGFAWKGSVFASLSQVAFAITGTRWNGPRFFGLRDRKSTRKAPGKGKDQLCPGRRNPIAAEARL